MGAEPRGERPRIESRRRQPGLRRSSMRGGRPHAWGDASQLQFGPHEQDSPHLHPPFPSGCAFWQPQRHSAPGQGLHAHWVSLIDIGVSPWLWLTSCQRGEVSHAGQGSGLNGAAIADGRSGYSAEAPFRGGSTDGSRVSRRSPGQGHLASQLLNMRHLATGLPA